MSDFGVPVMEGAPAPNARPYGDDEDIKETEYACQSMDVAREIMAE